MSCTRWPCGSKRVSPEISVKSSPSISWSPGPGGGPGRNSFCLHLFARLEQTLQAGVDFIHTHPLVYRLYLRVMFESHIPYRQEILASIRGYSHDFLKALILTAHERGELRADIQPDVAAFILDAVLDRYLQALSINHLDAGLGLAELDEVAGRLWIRNIVATLEKGLAAPSSMR